MNLLITLISSHLLTILENELMASEPEIVSMIVKEVELLINKLEAFINEKSPALASVLNPALDEANKLSSSAVNAAADDVMSHIS